MKKATVPAVAATFLVCAVFWLLITWSLEVQKLIAGAIICLVAALFSARFFVQGRPFGLLRPGCFFSELAYFLVIFPGELIKANWDVARRAFSPSLPVNPGIVCVPTGLKNDCALNLLANSITLTPGTITMDIADDEEGRTWYYIHCIDADAESAPEEKGEAIKGTLEKWAGRIFR